MGNAESTEGGGGHHRVGGHNEDDEYDPFDGIDTLGYRVLGVQPNSPASKAGLVSFLDFLVGANDRMLLGSGEGLEDGEEYDDVDLPGLLEENKNAKKPVEFRKWWLSSAMTDAVHAVRAQIQLIRTILTPCAVHHDLSLICLYLSLQYKLKKKTVVWNIKSQQTRLVDLLPADDWGGAGLLGVTIRLDNYAGAEDRLIRVLTVEDQSPASVAGLVPYKDFLLGTAHQTFENTQVLAAVLKQYEDRVVELYVYNCDSDLVRVVALMPTLSWGGGGLLGAEVGIGYLHRLPHTVRNTEGASVERKVRYVPSSKQQHPPVSNDNRRRLNGGGGGKTGADGAGEGTVLEMEPQLEMEPAEDEDDGSEREGGGGGRGEAEHGEDLSSVALTEAGEEDDNDSPGRGVDGGREPQRRREQQEAQRAPQSPSAMTDAATKRPSATGALPPPPKMHYDTPPRTVADNDNDADDGDAGDLR